MANVADALLATEPGATGVAEGEEAEGVWMRVALLVTAGVPTGGVPLPEPELEQAANVLVRPTASRVRTVRRMGSLGTWCG
ncbi:hypothetical protein [Kitasatospora brasiliensis]|uniref:hypothetical protein n=1 Tax=Kitasatospora brasiliensis TaxID=3058040 RepID=UPI00292DD6A6|nr:hypothetical protein [Kitasatospora sp. K002]